MPQKIGDWPLLVKNWLNVSYSSIATNVRSDVTLVQNYLLLSPKTQEFRKLVLQIDYVGRAFSRVCLFVCLFIYLLVCVVIGKRLELLAPK